MVAIGKQPDSSLIQISRKFLEPILDLSLSLYFLTWPQFPPSMPNIRWWCSLPGAEAKSTIGAVPMGLYATLNHYVSHLITLPPPPNLFTCLQICPLLHTVSTALPHRPRSYILLPLLIPSSEERLGPPPYSLPARTF